LTSSSQVTEDEAAPDARLDALLQQYGALLRRTIARVCPRDLGLSCDDIEQEARVGLWTALRNEREIAFPISYIRKVAVSATLRAIRRAKARREESIDQGSDADGASVYVPVAPDTASPYTAAERAEIRGKIAAALARLPENRQRAVSLHLKGLTTHEIAALLDWTEPKARNLVHRGLKDLRVALHALGIEYGR
jgi:RNA polymerase sigma factor (sigma-70 family)